MSPRKSIDESDARDRILAAAAEVFASVGFTGARVDDIAERAGINKAMLYYHVGDKERLYAAVLIKTVERGLATLTESTAKAQTPSAKLQCVLDAFADLGTSNPHLIPIMLREVASGGATLPDEMLVRMAGVFRLVQQVLGEGVEEGVFRPTDPLLTHVSLVGSIMFLVASQPIRARLGKIAGVNTQHSLRELADHTGNLFLKGLEVEPQPKRRKK
ncbi:MAG TPA: TetR/AcrR family transcriptional regulator [Thermoanaerobaculia bacterium]|jgi:AcrR family transcriptional regulator